MPDIILKDKGLKINWVKRLGLSHYLSEFLYISTWINNTDIWKCNVEAKDIDALFRKTPNKFNRDILNAWAHYSFHTPKTTLEIRNQFIWFNSHIKVNGKPTFHNIMYNSIIEMVGPVGPVGTLIPEEDGPGLCPIGLTAGLWPAVVVPLPAVRDPTIAQRIRMISLVENMWINIILTCRKEGT